MNRKFSLNEKIEIIPGAGGRGLGLTPRLDPAT